MNLLDLPDDVLKKIKKCVHTDYALSRKMERKTNRRFNKEAQIQAKHRKKILSNWWRLYEEYQDKISLDIYSKKIDDHSDYLRKKRNNINHRLTNQNVIDIIEVLGGDYPHYEVIYFCIILLKQNKKMIQGFECIINYRNLLSQLIV